MWFEEFLPYPFKLSGCHFAFLDLNPTCKAWSLYDWGGDKVKHLTKNMQNEKYEIKSKTNTYLWWKKKTQHSADV